MLLPNWWANYPRQHRDFKRLLIYAILILSALYYNLTDVALGLYSSIKDVVLGLYCIISYIVLCFAWASQGVLRVYQLVKVGQSLLILPA